jgi:hypothetical protein
MRMIQKTGQAHEIEEQEGEDHSQGGSQWQHHRKKRVVIQSESSIGSDYRP